MKYYEFNDAEYYALIRAKSEGEAITHYHEMVSEKDDDEDELQPDVVTKAEAKERYMKAWSRVSENEQADHMTDWNDKSKEPFLLLLSADLC